MNNALYYGDNLEVLHEHIKDESVDLIYLDPPFNSKRDYNLLFKTPKGHESDAQRPGSSASVSGIVILDFPYFLFGPT